MFAFLGKTNESVPMLVDTRQALLNGIRDNPNDDAPRLIFADWLEEHGEAERATYIRLAIELNQLGEEHPRYDDVHDRYAAIWREHRKQWDQGLPKTLLDSGFQNRGFWDGWRADGITFLRHIESLWQREPVSDITLTGPVEDFAAAVSDPRIGPIRELRMWELEGDPAMALQALAESPYLGQLRLLRLNIGDGTHLSPETTDALRRWRLPHLDELTISYRAIVRQRDCYEDAIRAMLEGALLRGVRAFYLNYDHADSGLPDAFLNAPTQSLHKLLIQMPTKSTRWLEVLTQSKRLNKLRVLRLNSGELPAVAWQRFFNSHLAAQLTALHFPMAHFPKKIFDILATTTNLRRLRELNLSGSRHVNDKLLERIGKNQQLMKSLRSLDLSATEVDPVGAVVQELRIRYPKCRIDV